MGSDLDVYVEVPNRQEADRLREALLDVRIQLFRKYATMISPYILTTAQARHPPNPALIESIRRDAVPLVSEG